MAENSITHKLIEEHLIKGELHPGNEIAIKIDQTLTQDATGTLVMLELEQLKLDRVKTEVSAQYVDHNLLQTDYKNPDDHLFLESACQKFGIYYCNPGSGISHVVHMSRLGVPGKTLLGSDSHTCASGALGMLAIGSGGLDVAMAMAGEPYYFKMPEIWGIYLKGNLPHWVSAKDVILELLRRHNVRGGLNKILEYYGPGLKNLSIMDRHVIANMGAELGATTSVFPSDDLTKDFLKCNGRENQWKEIKPELKVKYDLEEEIDLSNLVPLIAKPSSPGNVVPVAEVEGTKIYQSYIGSSANPGFRDFAISAEIVKGKNLPSNVSFDINISSREIMENLLDSGHLATLVHSGARIHQIGCNGCIGMGQAPASHQNSLRTVPRNFPGRSGTPEDKVWLCSPETAAASILNGQIRDPRNLKMEYPKTLENRPWIYNDKLLKKPKQISKDKDIVIKKGPNIISLQDIKPIGRSLFSEVILKVGDNVSTDEILPAGSNVLPFRSNIKKISNFLFFLLDPEYIKRAKKSDSHIIIAGENYGQGSSREHAALAPATLGLKAVIAKSFARIHWQNLISFGVLPLVFVDTEDYDLVKNGQKIKILDIEKSLLNKKYITVIIDDISSIQVKHNLSPRQIEIYLSGGLISWKKKVS